MTSTSTTVAHVRPKMHKTCSRFHFFFMSVRARSLHRVVVTKLDRPIPGHEECTHQIVDLSIPNPNDLMAWYVKIGMK